MTDNSSSPLPIMPGVLLLEDNAQYRALMAEVLSMAGFDVFAAADGRRVPQILRERSIDLVITDLVMPERDGLETMTDLHYSHPRLPVIAISGDVPLNAQLYLTLADKLGASRVLAKPFNMADLVSAARQAIAASAA
jgi:CheY-like chemotaxis protein